MKEKNLLKIIGQAIQDYHMIHDNDQLWVGISTAPKSLCALLFLFKRLNFVPIDYELHPIHILTPDEDETSVQKWYASLSLNLSLPPLTIISLPPKGHHLYHTNPRKAILQSLIHSCPPSTTLVLGDCMEDIVTSGLSALFYHQRWHIPLPHYPLTHHNIRIIRPLAYLSPSRLETYCLEQALPVLRPSRPSGKGKTHTKELLSQFKTLTPHPSEQIFAALRNPKRDYFLHF